MFSYINTFKSFSFCGPTRPPGPMISTNLLLYYVRHLSCKFQLFWPCDYWLYFLNIFPTNTCKNSFPFCGPTLPKGAMILTNLHFYYVTFWERFHVNFSFSGPEVLKKILNDPTPFLHFYDNLPLEKDPTLYLNKLEFPLPKDNLYQV
jgi:hypothetical protein